MVTVKAKGGRRKFRSLVACVAAITIAPMMSACSAPMDESRQELLTLDLEKRGFTDPLLIDDSSGQIAGESATFSAGLGNCRITLTWDDSQWRLGKGSHAIHNPDATRMFASGDWQEYCQ